MAGENDLTDTAALALIVETTSALQSLQAVGVDPTFLQPSLDEIKLAILAANGKYDDARDFDHLFPEQNRPRKAKIQKLVARSKQELRQLRYQPADESYDSDISRLSRDDGITDPQRMWYVNALITTSSDEGWEDEGKEI